MKLSNPLINMSMLSKKFSRFKIASRIDLIYYCYFMGIIVVVNFMLARITLLAYRTKAVFNLRITFSSVDKYDR